jgi:hypothetical protein
LKAKGANDAILNADNMTCYEGLNEEALAEDEEDVFPPEEEQVLNIT